jgi:peptide deformylase
MAIRNIRVFGDEILRKNSKEVSEITPRIKILIEDMFDTMYEADGVGLAASQVGVLKRIFTVDTGENPLTFVNPIILETGGEQTGDEGCLSNPGKVGEVTRPDYVKIRAFDKNMKEFELEATGLLARAICHEYDHLDGILFTDKMNGEVKEAVSEEQE